MADNFNLRTFLTENKLTKNAQLLKEARVEGFDENQKAFEVSFINKYGGGDFRILNAETPEQAEEVFTDIFINNPDFVQSIKSIEPYQVPAAKPQAEPQPGLEGVDYGSIELDSIDPDDYPDFVDAYVISAEFEDGTPLSEEELEQLTDELYQSGQLADMAAQSLYKNNKKPIMKETNLTAKERRLVEMVNSAMGYQEDEEQANDIEQAQHDIERQYEGSEMSDETVIPEYNTIDELMNSIDHGTNKVAEEHKMQEMKKIAQMLREKAKKMEESEHAAHISPKDLKQLANDAAKLEKAAEKLKLAFDKKFNKKEKPAAAAKAEKVEALQEGTFDLRKFLIENKMTRNSRMLSEVAGLEQYRAGMKLQRKGKPDETFTIQLVEPGTTKGMEAAMALHLKDDNTGKEFTDSPGNYEIVNEGQVNENGTYTQKEILRGNIHGFKAPKPEELKVDMMVTGNKFYGSQEELNQQMGRITAISGDKVTYKKGDGKLYNADVDDIVIVAS